VGVGEGGWKAVELALVHGDVVGRLVLVSTPPLEDGEPAAMSAKTLLLYGARDGGQRRALVEGAARRPHRDGPGAGDDILERVWPRVLSHVAPGSLRK
jgi:hypothetical protein